MKFTGSHWLNALTNNKFQNFNIKITNFKMIADKCQTQNV